MACDTPKVDRAYEGLIRELDLIKKAEVSDAELQKAINNLIGNHLISLQSSSDRAETFGLYTLYGLGYDFDPIYINKIREVTAADVLTGRSKVPGSGTLRSSQSFAGRRTKEEIELARGRQHCVGHGPASKAIGQEIAITVSNPITTLTIPNLRIMNLPRR